MSIPVAFALNNEYALTTYVAIKSMLMSASSKTEYHVYCLIPPNFKDSHMKKIEKLAIEFPLYQVTFIKMGNLFSDAFLGIDYISVQTYYRLLLAELLENIDKCIYLDGDLLVYDDLSELFHCMDDNYYLAGVKAPAHHLWSEEKKKITGELIGLDSFERYINVGVLVMNLRKLREDGITKELLEVIERKLPGQDEDALNIVCYEKIQLLPLKYNVSVYFINQNSIEKLFDANEVSEARRSPVIVHFANGKVKPWSNRNLIYAEKWWELAEKSGYDLNKIVIEEKHQEKERKYFYLLNRLESQNDIVIFGYTEISISLVAQLEKRGVEQIRCYCDNDKKKRGIAEDGKQILSLEEILKRWENPFFIVASQRFYKEIYAQLKQSKVPDLQIYRYRKLGQEYYLCLNEEGKKEDYII